MGHRVRVRRRTLEGGDCYLVVVALNSSNGDASYYWPPTTGFLLASYWLPAGFLLTSYWLHEGWSGKSSENK